MIKICIICLDGIRHNTRPSLQTSPSTCMLSRTANGITTSKQFPSTTIYHHAEAKFLHYIHNSIKRRAWKNVKRPLFESGESMHDHSDACKDGQVYRGVNRRLPGYVCGLVSRGSDDGVSPWCVYCRSNP